MTKIKDLPKHKRPREKLSEKGAENLSDAELLAILIRTGRAGRSALDIAKDALKAIVAQLGDLRGKQKEYFMALYLNARNQLILKETISVGTLTASLVHPREVFEPAIRNFASAVVLAHN